MSNGTARKLAEVLALMKEERLTRRPSYKFIREWYDEEIQFLLNLGIKE